MQWWMNAVDYPFLTSGKPQWSLAANIPVVFEMTILFAALTTFFAMWIMNNLPRWFSPALAPGTLRAFDRRPLLYLRLKRVTRPSMRQARKPCCVTRGAHAVEMVAEPEGSATPPLWLRHGLMIGATALLIPLTVIAYAPLQHHGSAADSLGPRHGLPREVQGSEYESFV